MQANNLWSLLLPTVWQHRLYGSVAIPEPGTESGHPVGPSIQEKYKWNPHRYLTSSLSEPGRAVRASQSQNHRVQKTKKQKKTNTHPTLFRFSFSFMGNLRLLISGRLLYLLDPMWWNKLQSQDSRVSAQAINPHQKPMLTLTSPFFKTNKQINKQNSGLLGKRVN